MSASSSAASSSSLTRPTRSSIFFFGVLSIACIYYCYQTVGDFPVTASNAAATGLHRSNAVHRRRRRTPINEEEVDNGQSGPTDQPGDIITFLEESTQDTTARPLGDGETVIQDPDDEYTDSWVSNGWQQEDENRRNGQNIVQLLFRVSEDATRRNAYVHRGCQCNSCGTVPIRGIRYKCCNCADFDLCEACEAQGLHIKTHVFYKVRVPTAAFAPRQMQPVWYPGDPDTCIKQLPRELVTKLSKETGFERPELDAYWEQWTFMANTEWREDPDDLCLAMDRKTFDQCLVPSGGNRTASSLIHDRMFAFYDQNNDDLISFPEFLNGLAYRRKRDKLKRVFEGYDINGDGFVDRKDFLRMFRSYYVLYKQMHRDMLESLDDQIMNSTEAHQLVTSRQPLSGAFGRDGRFPPGPDPRTGEGKTAGVDGDLDIMDGKGVTSENSNDFGNKEDVLIEAVIREHQRTEQQRSWSPTRSNTYWRAVSHPPETISELQYDVLDGLIRERRGEAPQMNNPPASRTQENENVFTLLDPTPIESSTSLTRFTEDGVWPPSFVRLEDLQAVCGPESTFENLDPQFRPQILIHARERVRDLKVGSQAIAVNDEIHERWKRRQFYTDEEEGSSPPADWKDEEDVPGLNRKSAEYSRDGNLQPLSPRSRSSSKVRFADDDDYDTRSNASTSSRSIAERWGGMEIPEAERDAGKEILYQVTQQAFNELLDPLFQKNEDLALTTLRSKDIRDKYRHMFTDESYERWANELESTLKKSTQDSSHHGTDTEVDMRNWRSRPSVPEVELPRIRQRNLNELLAMSGYSVNGSHANLSPPVPPPMLNHAEVSAAPDRISPLLEDTGTEANRDQGLLSAEHDNILRVDHDGLRAATALRVASEGSPATSSARRPLGTIQSILRLDRSAASDQGLTLLESDPSGTQEWNIDDLISKVHQGIQLSSGELSALESFLDTFPDSNRSVSSPDDPVAQPYRDLTLPQFRPNTEAEAALLSTPPLRRSSLETFSALFVPQLTPEPNARPGVPVSADMLLSPDSSSSPYFLVPEQPRSRNSSAASSITDPTSPSLPISESKLHRLEILPTQCVKNQTIESKLDVDFCTASKAQALHDMPVAQQKIFADVDWVALYKLREMDRIAREADERGGWGRVSWEEFEEAVKVERWGDGSGKGADGERWKSTLHVMEYLGSWIDFCIPP